MKNVIIIISIILLISTFFFQAKKFIGVKDNSRNEHLKDSKENKISKDKLLLFLENESVKVNTDAVLIDTLNNHYKVSDLLTNDGKGLLFVRFSHLDCNSCIDVMTSVIKKLPEVKRQKIVLLSDNIDQRDFLIKERKRNSGLKSFSFAFDNLDVLNFLGIPIEGKGLPFCFKINSNNETDKIYFPDVNSPDEIKLYFNEVIGNI